MKALYAKLTEHFGEKQIVWLLLRRDCWVCTKWKTIHHPWRKGMLTRAGRLSDHQPWDEKVCIQWTDQRS